MKSLGFQLGEMAATWRLNIPSQKYCGNLRFESDLAGLAFAAPALAEGVYRTFPRLAVIGLLTPGIPSSKPISSPLKYYKMKLLGNLQKLQDEVIFSHNRYLTPLIESFIRETLPKLKIFQEGNIDTSDEFIFTHYDLSPRNVLVTGNSPRISDIVDFEISGFFSTLDEFVNDAVDNEGDWSTVAYRAYCERLEQRGVTTPRKLAQNIWNETCKLRRMEENLAPWWLAEGSVQGTDLTNELEKAGNIVKRDDK